MCVREEENRYLSGNLLFITYNTASYFLPNEQNNCATHEWQEGKRVHEFLGITESTLTAFCTTMNHTVNPLLTVKTLLWQRPNFLSWIEISQMDFRPLQEKLGRVGCFVAFIFKIILILRLKLGLCLCIGIIFTPKNHITKM